MTLHRTLRSALPAALLTLVLAATPATALEPSVEVVDVPSTTTGELTDLAARGASVALTLDLESTGPRHAAIHWSPDSGVTWETETITAGSQPVLEPAVTVCGGRAVAVYAVSIDTETRNIRSDAHGIATPSGSVRGWTTTGQVARRPDAACVANTELALAWFEKTSSGYKVVLETGVAGGVDMSPQRFSLGNGTPGRELSVAATADRVYVAWFRGNTLKLRRYRIGASPTRTLTALGTTTLGNVPGGTTPQVGADGSRVVIAYTQGADLRVRRSTNRGVSFGSARTVRNLPGASEVGALATTLMVKGSKVALGVIDVGGIETLSGTGRGYKSTNGGSTFTRMTTHTGGRVLAAVVRAGSSYRWAEAWDHSLDGTESPGQVRFRRE